MVQVMRMRSLCTWLLLVALAGCPEPPPLQEARPGGPDAAVPLVVRGDEGLLFSFFDNRAEMRTVDRIDQVAETARADVMVTSPGRQLAGDLVDVVDLRTPKKDGTYRSWVEPKGTWLDRVVPRTSVSEKLMASAASEDPEPQPRKPARRRPKRRGVAKRPAQAGKAAQGATPRVILFSTAWCPSCKAARAFFKGKGVEFLELDVERDQQAQQQYLAIQQRFNLKPGVVPLIVVNGRVFQGFSRPQVEAALAAGPPA